MEPRKSKGCNYTVNLSGSQPSLYGQSCKVQQTTGLRSMENLNFGTQLWYLCSYNGMLGIKKPIKWYKFRSYFSALMMKIQFFGKSSFFFNFFYLFGRIYFFKQLPQSFSVSGFRVSKLLWPSPLLALTFHILWSTPVLTSPENTEISVCQIL